MKIVFGYYKDEDFGLTKYFEIELSSGDKKKYKEKVEEKKSEYKKFLLTAVTEDFPYPDLLADFYDEIKALERGKINELSWDGQSFQHEITKEKVTFTHTIFDICDEYPLWSCRFEEYKKVLKAWKKFLDLPQEKDTKTEVEI